MDGKDGVGLEDDDAVPTCEHWHRRLSLHRFVVFHVEEVRPSDGELSFCLSCTVSENFEHVHATGEPSSLVAQNPHII